MEPVSLLLLATAAIAAIVVTTLTLQQIKNWLTSKFSRTTWIFWTKNKTAELVLEHLPKAKRVHIGLTDHSGSTIVEKNKWDAKKLDDDLQSKFRYRDRIYIDNF